MNSDYEYVDPDNYYTDSSTGLLKNLLNITSKETLALMEYRITAIATDKIFENPPTKINSDTIFKIHKQLFQDIYSWAGQPRTVEISKPGRQFHPTKYFPTALQYIDNLISKYKNIPPTDKHPISKSLAELLDCINELHPFREGNGRTQRILITLLAKEKNYSLDLNPPDNQTTYTKYMNGTINQDIKLLTDLIEFQLIPIPRKKN